MALPLTSVFQLLRKIGQYSNQMKKSISEKIKGRDRFSICKTIKNNGKLFKPENPSNDWFK